MNRTAFWATLSTITLIGCSVPKGCGEAKKPHETAPALGEKAPPSSPESCGLPSGLREPGWPDELGATSRTESPARETEAETIVLVPDTQYYVGCRNTHLKAQMQFLNLKRGERKFRAALWLGDLTDHNSEEEWTFFKENVSLVERGLPLLLSTGNHDLGTRGRANSRETGFHRHFSRTFAENQGVAFELFESDRIDNAYYSIRLANFTLGVLMLEWSPRKTTIDWANRVITAHPKERVIVSTHAYLYSDDTRYDFAHKGRAQKWNPREYETTTANDDVDGNHDGEMLWNALVRKYPNVFLTVNGHVLNDGSGFAETIGDAGNVVHQMLANYQMLREGGLGYLRLLEFSPDGSTVHVKTYSPSLELYSLAPDQNFSFKVSPPLNAP